jgi:hypothetical protein
MEGFSFVTPVTGLNGPNTGKKDDDEPVTVSHHVCNVNLQTIFHIQCADM